MPVRKFRSVEEMNQPTWYRPGDPALYRAMAAVWSLGRATNPRRFPPGVVKFGSIDEMSRTQDGWDAEHAALLQYQRSGGTRSP